MNSRISLSVRLLLLTGIALLPAFAIVVTNEVSSRRMREAEAHAYVARMSDLAASELERALTAAATLMIAISEAPPVAERDREGCATYLQRVQEDLPQLYSIAVVDAAGATLCHSGAISAAALPRLTDPLIAELSDARFANGTYQDTAAGPVLPVGMRAVAPDGSERFVIIGISLKALEELIYDSGFETGSRLTIADRNNTILAHRPLTANLVGRELPERFAVLAGADRRGTASVEGSDGRELIVGYQPPRESRPFYIAVGLPKDQVMAPINAATLRATAMALAGAAAALLLAWVFGRVFVRRPVRQLVRTIVAWRNGDRSARTGMAGDKSELTVIGAAMDRLFDELQEREEAQRRAEQHRDVLARELEHRVKNLLAIVQVIARRTFSNDTVSAEARRVFQDRLNMLAKSQSMLTTGKWAGATMTETVEAAIEPFLDPGSDRVMYSGPQLDLNPKASLALSMALHELLTNAAKYGALSVPAGRVSIDAELHGSEENEQEVHLRWIERGGPPVAPPERTGFGSVMIRQMLEAETGGDVSVDYAKEGLTCDIRFPASGVAVEN